jgi:hypothetical protein
MAVVTNEGDELGREWYRRYYDSSVAVPSPEVDVIADAARTHNVYVQVGIIEKEGGTLYCTALLLGRDGSILLKHRKVSARTIIPRNMPRCVIS